jgi:hypothetical protein
VSCWGFSGNFTWSLLRAEIRVRLPAELSLLLYLFMTKIKIHLEKLVKLANQISRKSVCGFLVITRGQTDRHMVKLTDFLQFLLTNVFKMMCQYK